MLEWVSRDRDYKPEIVAAMTLAFDTVCRSLLAKESDNDDIRRKLALIILHHTDRGERDPARLADLSFRELMAPKRRCRNDGVALLKGRNLLELHLFRRAGTSGRRGSRCASCVTVFSGHARGNTFWFWSGILFL
jgi:hypothetical protein